MQHHFIRRFPLLSAKHLLAVFCALTLVVTASAQTSAMPASTLHVSAKLVLVDVVVTDADGNPVKGLSKDAFRLTESGKLQTVRNFEEHGNLSASAALTVAPKLQPGVFTNTVVTSANAPLNVLLLDKLNTPMMDQAFVRNQLLQYLKNSPPGARTAIFGLTDRLIMLQGFTSDPALLRAAVEHSDPKASSTLSEKQGGKTNIIDELNASAESGLNVSDKMIDALAFFGNVDKELPTEEATDLTLRAMHQLALYLAGIPGRKNLMWFSAGFPVNILPHGSVMSATFFGPASSAKMYRETVTLLAQSQVAVYPIDARGLMVSPLNQVTYTGSRAEYGAFSSNLFETHSTMFDMAEDTGGKAYVNTNGLAQAVQQVVDNSANYYTLAYSPSDSNAHGEYRSIHLELNGIKYKLAYRRGYYADTTNTTTQIESTRDTVKAAALFLAPASTQIPLYARVLPLPADAPDLVAPGDKVHTARTALQKDRLTRYSIEYSTSLRGITVTAGADGARHAHLEYIALVYNSAGRIVHSDVKPVQVAWKGAAYTHALQYGARYLQQISIPITGEYTLRLMVHDLTTDRIGSLDLSPSALQASTPPKP
jgi:VWFA-related protein